MAVPKLWCIWSKIWLSESRTVIKEEMTQPAVRAAAVTRHFSGVAPRACERLDDKGFTEVSLGNGTF